MLCPGFIRTQIVNSRRNLPKRFEGAVRTMPTSGPLAERMNMVRERVSQADVATYKIISAARPPQRLLEGLRAHRFGLRPRIAAKRRTCLRNRLISVCAPDMACRIGKMSIRCFRQSGVLWHFAEDPVSTDARVGH